MLPLVMTEFPLISTADITRHKSSMPASERAVCRFCQEPASPFLERAVDTGGKPVERTLKIQK